MVYAGLALRKLEQLLPIVQVRTRTHCGFLQRTGFDPAPPKVDPGNLLSMERS